MGGQAKDRLGRVRNSSLVLAQLDTYRAIKEYSRAVAKTRADHRYFVGLPRLGGQIQNAKIGS